MDIFAHYLNEGATLIIEAKDGPGRIGIPVTEDNAALCDRLFRMLGARSAGLPAGITAAVPDAPRCRRCGTSMVKGGVAIPPAESRGKDGQGTIGQWVKCAPLVPVMKCPTCGHSFTGTPNPKPETLHGDPPQAIAPEDLDTSRCDFCGYLMSFCQCLPRL